MIRPARILVLLSFTFGAIAVRAEPAPRLAASLIAFENNEVPAGARTLSIDVEVEARAPNGAPASLVLAAPGAGESGWASGLTVRLTGPDGQSIVLPWEIAPLTEARRRAALAPGRRAYASLSAKLPANPPLAPGGYRLVAVLSLSGGAGWRGNAESAPLEFSVAAPRGDTTLSLLRDITDGAPHPRGWPLLLRVIARPATFNPFPPPTLEVLSAARGAAVSLPFQSWTTLRNDQQETVFALDEAAGAALTEDDYAIVVKHPRAAEPLRTTLTMGPPASGGDPRLATLRLHIALHASRLEEAQQLALAALQAAPEDPNSTFNFAQVARAQGNRALAAAMLDRTVFLIEKAREKAGPSESDEYTTAHQDAPLPAFEILALREQIRAMPTTTPARPPATATAPAATTGASSSTPASAAASTTQTTASESDVRWATAARASSEYNTSNWGAVQAVGPPNVRSYGDSRESWTPRTESAGEEWLELIYEPAVAGATGVRVAQNFNPGALMRVELIAADGTATTVWNGPDTTAYAPNQIAILDVRFPRPQKPVARVKLTLDTKRVRGWKEIDAVALVAEP